MSVGEQAGTGFGGFTLGGMRLALPLAALREVAPRGTLLPLPCPAACVVGGIDLRGVVVPVVDLAILLGRPSSCESATSVIIVVENGSILGLLADGVSGVFFAEPDALNPFRVTGAEAGLLRATVHCADDGALVSVLCPAVLAAVPGVPWLRDPEPQRQAGHLTDTPLGDAEAPKPLMLLRHGRLALAIDAMAVHATLPNPRVRPMPMARGHWRGAVEYDARSIPAIDLAGLCGLGAMRTDVAIQAFVLRLDEGMIALLIEAVLDVARALPSAILPIPAFSLPRPEYFLGTLPGTAVITDVGPPDGPQGAHYLMINAEAVRTDALCKGLAATHGRDERAEPDAANTGRRGKGAARRDMITFALANETAVPLEQVAEILPFAPHSATFALDSAILGIQVDRGRSIPVVCLTRLTTGQAGHATPSASVLVVESDGEHIGFVVPALKAIEPAHWEPELPHVGPQTPDPVAAAMQPRHRAEVGDPGALRMLPVLDLAGLARDLRRRGCPVADVAAA